MEKHGCPWVTQYNDGLELCVILLCHLYTIIVLWWAFKPTGVCSTAWLWVVKQVHHPASCSIIMVATQSDLGSSTFFVQYDLSRNVAM